MTCCSVLQNAAWVLTGTRTAHLVVVVQIRRPSEYNSMTMAHLGPTQPSAAVNAGLIGLSGLATGAPDQAEKAAQPEQQVLWAMLQCVLQNQGVASWSFHCPIDSSLKAWALSVQAGSMHLPQLLIAHVEPVSWVRLAVPASTRHAFVSQLMYARLLILPFTNDTHIQAEIPAQPAATASTAVAPKPIIIVPPVAPAAASTPAAGWQAEGEQGAMMEAANAFEAAKPAAGASQVLRLANMVSTMPLPCFVSWARWTAAVLMYLAGPRPSC